MITQIIRFYCWIIRKTFQYLELSMAQLSVIIYDGPVSKQLQKQSERHHVRLICNQEDLLSYRLMLQGNP